jgi:MHS family proline/betaine transporter-like MFS transporter
VRGSARLIAAGAIGNVLEWYDFAVYGYFASVIGRTFFPGEDPLALLLSAYGIFAVGFVARPLGGAVIGHIGDRYGRRAALTLSVVAMALPTCAIGLLPGYQTLGVAAPILLTVLRVIQGLSVGGETTTSIVFLVEHAPERRRALMATVSCGGATAGIMMGSAAGAVLASVMPTAALDSWGWRIPFVLGLLVGVAGYFIRRDMVEEPRTPPLRPPLVEAVHGHGLLIARLFGMSVLNACGFFVMFVYIVSWLERIDGVDAARALDINTINMVLQVLVMVATAWLSDRIGRKPLMLTATALCFVGALPLLWLMHHPDPLLIFAGQFGVTLLLGTTWGVQPAIMVEATPPGVRCTVIAIAFNLAMGLVGGLSPLVATWLVASTHLDLSPAFLVMAAAAVTFLSVLSFGESYRSKLALA